MSSKITLKNNIDTEFTIEHSDNNVASTVTSQEIAAVVDTVVGSGAITYPSENILGYGRNWFDIHVPEVTDFIDNVFSVQNKSSNGTIYGNAAIAFLDGAGVERGAVGYSRNNTIQPSGYVPNTLYCEIGNPFTTDSDVTHFRVINTIAAGGAYWGGASKSYYPIECRADTGTITLNAGQGGGKIHITGGNTLIDDLAVGDISSTPAQISVAMETTAARFRQYGITDSFSLTTNVSNLLDGAITKDNNTKSAWKLSIGSGFDTYNVAYCGASATTWTNLFSINSSGGIKQVVNHQYAWNMSVDDTNKVYVANGATYAMAGSAGMILINDYTGGASAMYLVSAGNVLLVSQTGSGEFVSGAPAAGKVGITFSGGVYNIVNNKGSDTTFGVFNIATRQTA